MKHYTLALLALLVLILSSCVEDETYVGGKVDIQVEATQITSSTAVITVTFPETKDQIANPYNQKYGQYPSFISVYDKNNDNDNFRTYNLECKPNQYKTLIYNLIPNTEHRVRIDYRADVNDKNHLVKAEYDGFSFKTAKEGDYEAIGLNLTCEFLSSNDQYTYILFHSSSDLEFDRSDVKCYAYAGTNSDMSNPIEGHIEIHRGDPQSDFLAIFPRLENDLYRFSISGDFRYNIDNETPITLYGFIINSANVLNINTTQKESEAICSTPFVGEDFSLLEFTLPQNWYYNEHISSILYKRPQTADFTESIQFGQPYSLIPTSLASEGLQFLISGRFTWGVADGYPIDNLDASFTSDLKPLSVTQGTRLFNINIVRDGEYLIFSLNLPKDFKFETYNYSLSCLSYPDKTNLIFDATSYTWDYNSTTFQIPSKLKDDGKLMEGKTYYLSFPHLILEYKDSPYLFAQEFMIPFTFHCP